MALLLFGSFVLLELNKIQKEPESNKTIKIFLSNVHGQSSGNCVAFLDTNEANKDGICIIVK